MIGLAGVPRSMVQEIDIAENDKVVPILQTQSYTQGPEKGPEHQV